jgi:hypothetical protein
MAFTGRLAGAALTQVQLDNNFLCHYPVGAIYMNANRSDSPNNYIGYGKWKKFCQGRILVGDSPSGSAFEAGEEDGHLSHEISISQLPSHNHGNSLSNAGRNRQRAKYNDNNYMKTVEGFGNNIVNSSYSGGNIPHSNIQPYITVHMWERTT